MVVDPSSAESTRSLLSALRPAFAWAGRTIGVTSAPNCYLGALASGSLPSDPRPAYALSYLVMAIRNVQREGRSQWLTTNTAIHCTGTIRVLNELGHQILKDSVVFCGGGMPPSQELSLSVDDDRFHIPVLSRLDQFVEHHTNRGVRLQPGTYVLGQHYFSGLHETARLKAGKYDVVVSVRARNGDETWERSETVVVEHYAPQERSLLFKPKVKVKDGVEWVNLYVRASQRLDKLADVRLTITHKTKTFPLNWSVNNGRLEGEPTTVVYPDADVLALIAVRSSSANVILGTSVRLGKCYVTEQSFRVNKQPVRMLEPGANELIVTARFGSDQQVERFVVTVPDAGFLTAIHVTP